MSEIKPRFEVGDLICYTEVKNGYYGECHIVLKINEDTFDSYNFDRKMKWFFVENKYFTKIESNKNNKVRKKKQ